jgi:flavin-dependent dehydrogenase
VSKGLKVTVTDETLKMEIPLSLLKHAAENGPGGYIVTDHAKFVEYLREVAPDLGFDSEDGSTVWTTLLDEIFDNAYENDEEWIKSSMYEEDDDD